MTVTQAQLQTVMHFTLGAQSHRVIGYSLTSALERTGVGHNAFRRYVYSINTELQGLSLANLKTQLDDAKSNMIGSGSDFALFRQGTKVHEHLAGDCHFGPVASINLDGVEQSGTIESVIVTIECVVPVSTSGGVIDHTWQEATSVDDEGDLVSIVRTGSLLSIAGHSAKAEIEGDVPSQPAGYDRTLDIRTEDTDTTATYTLTDRKTDRRNYDANVRDHKFTKTTVVRSGILEEITHNGTVRMADGQSARTFIEANLPAGTDGFAREYRITNSDDDRDGSYSVTDRSSSWSGIPGIARAQLEATRSVDAQGRVVLERRGYFIGASAQIEIDAVRAALAALGVIVSEEQRQDVYDDQRLSFRFTALTTDDDPVSGITLWQEVVRKGGGGLARRVSLYPDRNPFIYFGEPQPVLIDISGRAVSVTGRYVDDPGPPASIFQFQDQTTDVARNRLNEIERETAWHMTFICPPGTAAPDPRSRPEPPEP